MRKFMSFWLAAIMLAAAFMVGVAAEDTVAAVEETAGIVDCDTCEDHDHDVTVAPEEVTDDSELETMASCSHVWSYYDVTSSSHTRRCTKCGNTYPNLSHNSRTVECTKSYTCECGYTISAIPHNTQWRTVSSGRHKLVCTNSYCSYAIDSSEASCTYDWKVGVPVSGSIHKGYGVCTSCGGFVYNSSFDQPCQGTGCPYCK